MKQLDLPLLMRHDAPRVVHPDEVAKCATYRDAVKLCWELRRVHNMTKASLAEHAGLYAPHVTKYLRDGKHQRDLPAERIKAFEVACDNTAITQFLSKGAKFTVVEEMQARNVA